jgi:hypothetical protein
MTKQAHWTFFRSMAENSLAMAPQGYLEGIAQGLRRDGVCDAVAAHDTPALYDWLVGVMQLQGIADRSAAAFVDANGLVSWEDVAVTLAGRASCPRLSSFWHFHGCGYRKDAAACAEPLHIGSCSIPQHPTRKGSLIIGAYALALFMRDVCDCDFVGWIDRSLEHADPGPAARDRGVRMGAALLDGMRGIYSLGDKVLSMALADLLLAADPQRERWVTTGASMIAIDTLLHNHLHRSGVLRRFGAEHPYGPRCYAAGGCSDLVRGLAERIDARQFDTTYPANFPRFIQFAIWQLCSTSGFNVCNGNQIDDTRGCANDRCPAFAACDRLALFPAPERSGGPAHR